MEESAYRSPPKAELVIHAGGSSGATLWSGIAVTLLAVAAFLFGVAQAVGLYPFLVVFLALLVGLSTYTSRRNRWRFTLERQRLRVERLLPAGVQKLGVLDVSHGLRIRVDVPEERGGIEARLTLGAGEDEIQFYPGERTAALYHELARFLREHELEIDAPEELPRLPEGGVLKLPKS